MEAAEVAEQNEAEIKTPNTVLKEEDARPDPNAKDAFKKLTQSYKDSLNGLNAEQLKGKLAEIEILQQHNTACKAADEDIKSLRSKLQVACSEYVKEAADLKLKAKCIVSRLGDAGDVKAEEITQLNLIAKGFKAE